jgi:hypothetical protein
MKTMHPVLIAALMVSLMPGNARAGDALQDTVRGGLLGAAAGVLVSEFRDDDDARFTIPFFTGLGALTGYAVHQSRGDDRYSYGPRRHRRLGGAAYGLPYLALPYAWYTARHPSYRRHDDYSAPTRRRQAPEPSVRQPPADRHPGVRLIRVPVPLPNGSTVPVTILNLGNRFIGPRGEAYETMPDAETLRLRYTP